MRLFFDTETSGLYKETVPFDDPGQPALCQLGVQVFDMRWRRVGSLFTLIRPDGWSIEPDAEKHHGISEARCSRYGIPLVAALLAFKSMVENCRALVAHNAEFDRKVIRAALSRSRADDLWWQRRAPAFFCTMETMTPVCQLPGDYGFKYPSLEEAHRFCYPAEDYATLHDAEADTDACVRIFKWMEGRGLTPSLESRFTGAL